MIESTICMSFPHIAGSMVSRILPRVCPSRFSMSASAARSRGYSPGHDDAQCALVDEIGDLLQGSSTGIAGKKVDRTP